MLEEAKKGIKRGKISGAKVEPNSSCNHTSKDAEGSSWWVSSAIEIFRGNARDKEMTSRDLNLNLDNVLSSVRRSGQWPVSQQIFADMSTLIVDQLTDNVKILPTKKERGKRNVRLGRRSGRKPRSEWRLICSRGVVARETLNPEGN